MTKLIVNICYKLLYIIQGVKSIFDKVTSWPQLILKLLVAPACLHAGLALFLHPWCFCLAFKLPKIPLNLKISNKILNNMLTKRIPELFDYTNLVEAMYC